MSPEFEELRAKFELLEQMYQPVQTENEQRKQMMSDTRKAALEISRSRQDLNLPTKRMGELDNVRLLELGISAEDISLLQNTVCDPNFHPWRVQQQRGSARDGVETVVNWTNRQLQDMVRKYDGGGNGRQVAQEVLRCNRELNHWNPSGGYCVVIPYHHGERRELNPEELLKIAVGINVPGCRQPETGGHTSASGGASYAMGGAGRRGQWEDRSQGRSGRRAEHGGGAWSQVVAGQRQRR
jgi:hypothetical protein